MPSPGRFDLTRISDEVDYSIYSGADWVLSMGAYEPRTPEDLQGGRLVDDLIVTAGSTTATSASALFTANDDGRKIATESGEGIVDGTTMDYLSPTSVTLSQAATVDGIFVATVRSMNLVNYSGHKAQVRRAPKSTVVHEITVDDSRKTVGWYLLSISAAASEATVDMMGVWDWRVDGPTGGRSFWMAGDAHVRANVTSEAL